tara:strand:+ start:390 stop:578 length:189 start_codon:yes stop_codon:yes gene_type:complete
MITPNDSVSKLVEIIKGMKPREQTKCIQKIIEVLSKSKLRKSHIVDEWLQTNGFLKEEEYII